MSIALDAQGTPHVAYSGQDAVVRLARREASGAWTIEAVAGEQTGRAPSLALDAGGSAHVSLVGADGLLYATNAGGAWRSVRLAAAGPADTAIALDLQGKVHIAFFASGGVEYATNR
jgi:hypothetical protein